MGFLEKNQPKSKSLPIPPTNYTELPPRLLNLIRQLIFIDNVSIFLRNYIFMSYLYVNKLSFTYYFEMLTHTNTIFGSIGVAFFEALFLMNSFIEVYPTTLHILCGIISVFYLVLPQI